MPWNGRQFASKHNKKLHGKAASKAAEQATTLVNKGMDEGEAIAIANQTGNKLQHKDRTAKGKASRMYKHK